MQIKKIASICITYALLTSCIDEIKLDVHTGQQYLVVDGQVTDSLQVHTIKVNNSAIIGSVSTDNILTPVTGASVRVIDDVGGAFDFNETADGVYTREMQGEEGRAYHIEVRTPNGKTVLSRPTILSEAPPIQAPTATVTEELTISQTGRSIFKNKLALAMNIDLSGVAERPYIRWRATGEYEFGEDFPGIISRKICYIKHNIDFNNVRIYDTNELAGGVLTNEPFLLTNYDYRYYFMYCFHLFQYAISAEEYDYWKNVRDIVNIDGSLFDPPPGTVNGNLYNPDDPDDKILGYFSVAGVYYARYFTNAIALGVSTQALCSEWPRPNECGQCLLIANSTTERPVYWEP